MFKITAIELALSQLNPVYIFTPHF